MHLAHILLLHSTLIAGFAAPARAVDPRAQAVWGTGTSFSVGVLAGGHVFADGTNLGTADGQKSVALSGLRASFGVGPWFVAEAEIVGLAREDRLDRGKARILGYRINALAPLMAGGFRPFVLIGAGAMQVASSDAQASSGIAGGTKAEIHTGIGFDYHVVGILSLRGDARVLQVPNESTWGLTSDVEAMVSASVALGRSRPVPVALPPSESVELSAMESAAMTVSTGGRRTVSDLLERGREIRFDPGTPKLLEASLPFLDALATALVQDPAARLEIVVHTADSGDAKKDLTLSKRRAEAVKSMLVVKGASAAQLLATGRGSEDPVAPNLTRTGRLRNERVELHRASSPLPGA